MPILYQNNIKEADQNYFNDQSFFQKSKRHSKILDENKKSIVLYRDPNFQNEMFSAFQGLKRNNGLKK